MPVNRTETYFFVGLLFVALILTFFLFLPYLNAMLLALTLVVTFYPFHRKILSWTHGRAMLSSFLTLITILVVIFAPFVYFSYQIVLEARQVYLHIGSLDMSAFQSKIQQYLPYANLDLTQRARDAVAWLFGNLGSLFSGASSLFLLFLVTLFAIYYFLKDGEKIRTVLIRTSPLPDRYNENILDRLEIAINSVFRGNLIVSIMHGTVAGVGFWLFGVPNAIFWGAVCVLAALIPVTGVTLVVIPAAIYLFMLNHVLAAIGLLLWTGLVTTVIENMIRPFLYRRNIKIHPFLILLSMLGGLNLFGAMGFITGPLILSFLFALVDIYPYIVGKEKTAVRDQALVV